MTLVQTLLIASNLVLSIPIAVFATEVFASLLPRRQKNAVSCDRPAVAVIVPAHDEATGIAHTVTALLEQLRPGDRLVVVADNCSDDTARLAKLAGAEVIARHEPHRVGKGFALDRGIQHLSVAPPAVVIIVDADCTLSPGSIDHLAAAAACGRPVQALNLMAARQSADIRANVAELAFLVKNKVRPTGLARLGFGCQLTGTGMAFPWAVIRSADLAHGSLVEDMKLGVDLALAGKPALFCPDARIDSDFPHSAAGMASQRKRWEEGHIGMISMAFTLMPRALALRNLGALTLVLDILVPPLTLLIVLAAGALAATMGITYGLGLAPGALWIALLNWLLVGAAGLAAWYVFGREVLPARAIPAIVPYMLSKFGLYGALLGGKRSTAWIRTDRSDGGEGV